MVAMPSLNPIASGADVAVDGKAGRAGQHPDDGHGEVDGGADGEPATGPSQQDGGAQGALDDGDDQEEGDVAGHSPVVGGGGHVEDARRQAQGGDAGSQQSADIRAGHLPGDLRESKLGAL